MRHRRLRPSVAGAALLAAALLAVSCFDDPIAPPLPYAGQFALAPAFESAISGIVPVDRIRITLERPGDTVLAIDTTVAIGADQDSVDLSFTVGMLSESETFILRIALISPASDTVFRGGPITVTPSTAGAQAPQIPVNIVYSGVGADAAGVRILTPDTTTFFGDTVTFGAEAVDSSGNAIAGTPIAWLTLDSARASVPNEGEGRVVGGTARGTARIVAQLLTSQADTAALLVQPVPNALAIAAGDAQSAVVGTAVTTAPRVRVTAADAQGVQDVLLLFETTDGTVAAESVLTDTAGYAESAWTLGQLAGTQTLTATAAAFPTLTASFTAQAQPAEAATIEVVSGDAQSGTVGAALTDSLVVRALDQYSNVAPGAEVTWTITLNNGAVSPATSVSDASGLAATAWTLGTTAGDNAVQASIPAPLASEASDSTTTGEPDAASNAAAATTVTFTATGDAAGAAALELVSGDAQSGIVGTQLADSLVVRAVDAFGNPVASQRVDFTVALGGGAVATGSMTTDPNGLAHDRWTLGTVVADSQRVRASAVDTTTSLPIATVDFVAIPLPDSPAQLVFTLQPAGAAAGSPFAADVTVRDQYGNPVTSDDTTVVSLAIVAGTGTAGAALLGTASDSAAAGVAQFVDLAIDSTGTGYQLAATAPGLAPDTSAAFDVNAGAVALVTVTPGAATITSLNATRALAAQAFDSLGNAIPGAAFTWSTSDSAVATADVAGVVTALANGLATITATSDTVSGTAAITVAQVTDSVAVTPATAALASIGATQQFTAEAFDSLGSSLATQPTFGWSSSNTGVATVDPSTGLATAVSNGSATITATGDGVAGTATLNVAQGLDSIAVSPADTTVTALDATVSYGAVAYDALGQPLETQPAFTWSTSNGAIATIDPSTGVATAAAPGAVTVTATVGAVTGSTGLTVTQVATSITVTPADTTFTAIGDALTYAAQAFDANANALVTQPSFTWSADSVLVATVDAGTGLLTTVGNGIGEVTATAGAVSGSTGLTVTQAVSAIVVTPADTTVTALGDTVFYAGDARDANGNSLASQPALSWTSSDTGILTIEPASGIAVALANGAAKVYATAGGVTDSTSVTVSQVAATVAVTLAVPGRDTLHAFTDTTRFLAEARDANDSLIVGRSFTWNTTAPAVGSVDAAGLAAAVGNGAAAVTASMDAASASDSVFVDQVSARVTFTVQPSAVIVTDTLVSSDSIRPAVQVALLDSLGNTVLNGDTVRPIGIGLATDPNPPAGRSTSIGGSPLLGGDAIYPTNGVATFDSLRVTTIGSGFVLTAQASASRFDTVVAPDTSQAFTVKPLGTTITWTGASDGNWANGANWDSLRVPTTADNAFVPQYPVNQPTVGGLASVGGLYVEDGAPMQVAGGITLSVLGDLVAGNARGLGIGGTGTIELAGSGRTAAGKVPNLLVSDSVALSAQLDVTGGATVSGSLAGLLLNGDVLSVAGDFVTTSSGVVWMTQGFDQISVGGSATFAGGPSTLDSGEVLVAGDFTQSGFTGSYAPSASHRTVLNGGGVQLVNFEDAVSSYFGELRLDSANTIRFEKSASALWRLVTPAGMTPLIIGPTGATLTVGGVNVNGLKVDSIPFAIVPDTSIAGDTAFAAFDNVTFDGYEQTVSQLTIDHSAPDVTFNNVAFLTQPSSGWYLTVIDTLWDDRLFGIYLVNSSPRNGSAFTNIPTSPIPSEAEVFWSSLAFTAQPASTTPSTSLGTVQVTIRNPDGSTDVAFSGNVSIAIENDPSAGATLGGTTTVAAVSGVATFSNLTIDLQGVGYTLRATAVSDPSLTDVSASFDILSPLPVGTDAVWLGSANTSWTNTANWDIGSLPASGDTVFIRSIAPNQPTLDTTDYWIGSLVVEEGATLTVPTGNVLTVGGTIDAGYTSIAGAGTVVMADDGNLRGAFPNLEIQFVAMAVDSVIVNGKLRISGEVPTLDVNGNTVRVTDSLIQDGWPGLLMDGATDSVIVDGSVDWRYADPTKLTNGVLVIGGNFFADYSFGGTYEPSANHKTVFNGAGAQTIGMDIAADTANHFHHLEIRGTAQVTADSVIAATGNTDILESASLTTAALSGTQLLGNLTVLGNGKFHPGGSDMTVSGNLATQDQGVLQMDDAGTALTVGGNATFGGASTDGSLTAGSLLLGGDFTQLATNSDFSFAPSGTHQTAFAGNVVQQVSFATPDTTGGSRFQELLVRQADTATLRLNSPVPVRGNVEINDFSTTQNSQIVTGTGELIVLGNVALSSDGYGIDVRPRAVRLRGTLINQDRFRPDTAEFFGAGQLISTFDTLDYRSVVVSGDSAIIKGVTANGSLIIRGSGYARIDTTTVTVRGHFRTEGSARLVMSGGGGNLSVDSNATFGGGSTAGLLTGGTLSVRGNFTQLSTASTSSFAPDGNFTTVLNGPGDAQIVSFEDPTASFFNNLTLSQSQSGARTGMSMASDVSVHGTFAVADTGTARQKVVGNAKTLTVGGLNVSRLALDSTMFVWTDAGAYTGTYDTLNIVDFLNADPTWTQFSILHAGGAFNMDNLTFNTSPDLNVGYYVKAEDADGLSPILQVGLGYLYGGSSVPETSELDFIPRISKVNGADIFYFWS